jgi:mannan endo-1,4-beta-mannosidase
MKADGAGWAYFMPWYGDYTMDGWAHDNTADDWKKILNSDYVITLDKMPGWDKYTVTTLKTPQHRDQKDGLIHVSKGWFELSIPTAGAGKVELYSLRGTRIVLPGKKLSPRTGAQRFNLTGIAPGMYVVTYGFVAVGNIVIAE